MNTLSKINSFLLALVIVFTVACKEDEVTLTPTITSITETAKPGDVITAEGTDLAGCISVTFGDVEGTEVTATATTITVTVPELASGKVDVTFTFGGEVSATEKITISGPSIDEVLTQAKVYIGTKVLVYGTGFTDVTGVSIGDVAVDIASINVAEDGTSLVLFAVDANGPISISTAEGTGVSATSLEVDNTSTVILISDFDGNGHAPSVEGLDDDGEKYSIWGAGGDIINDNLEGSGGAFGTHLTFTADGLTWNEGPRVSQWQASSAGFGVPASVTDMSKVFFEAQVMLTHNAESEKATDFNFWINFNSEGWDNQYGYPEGERADTDPTSSYLPADYAGGEWVSYSMPLSSLGEGWGGGDAPDAEALATFVRLDFIVSLDNFVETTVNLDEIYVRYEH
ncbi:MAG: IPT/TIG domain-containing protein [Reichenbachiella sp.]